jgi:hypothetical protein
MDVQCLMHSGENCISTLLCSARKVITLGYEDSGFNRVMKRLCYIATKGQT